MSDTLDYITDIMPHNSGFMDSDLYKVMSETITPFFDELYGDNSVYNSIFINLATGESLDRLGRNYGIKRELDEGDDDYRSRLRFQADRMVNLDNLLELGCEVYEFVDDYDLESTLLSRNVTEANKLLIVTPNEVIKQLLEDNLLLKSVVII